MFVCVRRLQVHRLVAAVSASCHDNDVCIDDKCIGMLWMKPTTADDHRTLEGMTPTLPQANALEGVMPAVLLGY